MRSSSISLPAELKLLADKQAELHGFSSTGDYVSELLRRQGDLDLLRQKLVDGLESGKCLPINENWYAALHERAR